MIVYVVMSNDYPDSVFAEKADAESYCELKRTETKARCWIFWKVYKFEVKYPEVNTKCI